MSNTPQIRFAGFTDAWEQRKLGECFAERSERSAEGELIAVTINSGVVKASELNRHDNSSEDKSNYKVVRKNDIAYNSMRMWQGASGFSRYDGILSPAYTVLIPKEGVNSHFFAYMFKLYYMIHEFEINSQGLTKDTWNLKYPALSPISIFMPKYEEQTKIADYFEKLDTLITLHQRKCDALQKFKKSMLQKMFPQNGESVPKIRFAGFTDAWEQRKLGECVTFLDTMRKPLKESEREKGIYPYYGASGIVDYVSDYIFDEELVLLSEDGANITDRNYPVCFLASGKYWVNNHAHVLKVNAENENNFICNSLERMDFTQYNSGMAMPKLNKDVCHNIPLFCPIYEEQKQIGDFFRNLDNLITLHQRKLETLQKMKKSLLQKMFP